MELNKWKEYIKNIKKKQKNSFKKYIPKMLNHLRYVLLVLFYLRVI